MFRRYRALATESPFYSAVVYEIALGFFSSLCDTKPDQLWSAPSSGVSLPFLSAGIVTRPSHGVLGCIPFSPAATSN